MASLLVTCLEPCLLECRERGLPKGLLAGRSAPIVVTMGMPALIYRWCFRAHGVRGLERSVLKFAGMMPVRETLLGMVDVTSAAKRRAGLTG
jgi:putative NADPH-quinone reductase